jgi:hypothetical protein
MQNLLITFGCSWTYGVGSGYITNMSKDQYREINQKREINDKLSFRGILSKKHELKNVNFAEGGSSNQKQFRQARVFFGSDYFHDLKEKCSRILVLWGITSTARIEIYQPNQFQCFSLTSNNPISSWWLKNAYDHNTEVSSLAVEMRLWNKIFQDWNIPVLWFDTFNHHDYHIRLPELDDNRPGTSNDLYRNVALENWPTWEEFRKQEISHCPQDIQNQVMNTQYEFAQQILMEKWNSKNLFLSDSNPRDILSQLCISQNHQNIDRQYHHSDFTVDTDRIDILHKKNLVNPYTLHPTHECHHLIADMFDPWVCHQLEL